MEESPYIKLLNRSSEFRVQVKERNGSWVTGLVPGNEAPKGACLLIREDSKFNSLKKKSSQGEKNRKFLSF